MLLLMLYLCMLYIFIFFFLYLTVNKVDYFLYRPMPTMQSLLQMLYAINCDSYYISD